MQHLSNSTEAHIKATMKKNGWNLVRSISPMGDSAHLSYRKGDLETQFHSWNREHTQWCIIERDYGSI